MCVSGGLRFLLNSCDGLRPGALFLKQNPPSVVLLFQINVWDMLVVCASVYMGPTCADYRDFQGF